MFFRSALKLGIGVNSWSKTAVGNAEKARIAWGVVFLLVAGAALAVGSLSSTGLLFLPPLFLLLVLIQTSIFYRLARLFGASGRFKGVFLPLAYASIVFWLTVIPVISVVLAFVIIIWYYVLAGFVITSTQRVSSGNAALIVIIGFIIFFLLLLLLITIYGVTPGSLMLLLP